jgi:hypothetical protein
MAAIKIKARGRTAPKPVEDEAPKATTRRSTRRSKASAKRQPAKRDSTATPKRGPGRPRKSTSTTATATAPVKRRDNKALDPRVEARVLKLVEKMGDRRAKAEAEHQEAINALHEAAQEALEVGVSMAKVSDASGISRQWLYKMGDFRGRGNGGNGSKATPAKTTTKTPVKRTSARKSTTTRKATTKATGGPRRRVAIRSAG